MIKPWAADSVVRSTNCRPPTATPKPLEELLRQDGVAWSALTGDVAFGGAFSVGTNVHFDASWHALQIDIDGNGTFTASADFQITLIWVSALAYAAAKDWFVLS